MTLLSWSVVGEAQAASSVAAWRVPISLLHVLMSAHEDRLFNTPFLLTGTVSLVLRAVNRTAFGATFGPATTF
jgi:hypothetical protein